MTPSRKKLFKFILALFVILSLWWTFYFPYDRNRLFLAVPSNAVFITEHRKLAARWKSIARNPVVTHGLISSGIKLDEIDQTLKNPAITALVRLLAPRNTVIAFVPDFQLEGRPAWIISSWVGGREKLLTWNILRGALSDFTEMPVDDTRKAWVLDIADSGPFTTLSMSVVEGVAVCCISSSSADIDNLVRRLETRHSRGARIIENLDFPCERGLSDMGWVNLKHLGAGFGKISTLRYAFSKLNNDHAVGWVKNSTPLPVSSPDHDLSRENITELNSLLGSVPDALVLLPFQNIRRYLELPEVAERERAVGEILSQTASENSAMFLSLQGHAYSIKVQKLTFPSLVMGLKVRNGSEAMAAVPAMLQKINMHYKTSFVPRHAEVAGRPAIVMESAKARQYTGFGPDQKPTFSSDGNWLLLGSNMSILETIFMGSGKKKEPAAGEIKSAGSLAYGWLDLDAAGAAVNNALSVYSIVLWFDSSEDSSAMRDSLEKAMEWCDAIRLLKSGSLHLDSDGANSIIRFSLGEK